MKFTDAGFYPECPDTVAQSLWDDAWRWCVQKFRLRENEIEIPLVEDVRQYDYPPEEVTVWQAYYQPTSDAASWQALYGTAGTILARTEPGWLATSDSTSQPWRYFIRSYADGDSSKRVIEFDPIPLFTTDGTYPRVYLYTVENSPLTGTDEVPAFLPSDDLFLYEMAFRWAVRQDPDRALWWKKMRDVEWGEISNYSKATSDDVPVMRIQPMWNIRQRRAI